MTNEINSIIDHLCAKLGTTANMLIPELGKLKVAQHGSIVLLTFIGLLYSTYYMKVAWKYDHKDPHQDSVWFGIPLTVFCSLFLGFIINVYFLVGWIMSPTAMSVMLISGALK